MWWSGESGSGLGSGSGGINNTASEDDSTLSCAARNIQGPVQYPIHQVLVAIVRVCGGILYFLASFGGLFLNGIVVISVIKYKKLQKIYFKIAASLAALNIVLSAGVFLGLINSIANRWLFGEHGCGISGAILLLVGLGRTLVLLIFVIDRFLSVFIPSTYPKYQKVVLTILSFASLLLSITIVVIGYVLDCYEFQTYTFLCYSNADCNGACALFLSIVDAVVFVPANVIPAIMYTMLFIKAKKMTRAMTEKSNWNATITFFLIFLMAFVLILPNTLFALIVQAVYSNSDTLPAPLYVWLVISSRIVTFILVTDAIFILRNKDAKNEIKETLRKLFQRRARNKVHVQPRKTNITTANNEEIQLRTLAK